MAMTGGTRRHARLSRHHGLASSSVALRFTLPLLMAVTPAVQADDCGDDGGMTQGMPAAFAYLLMVVLICLSGLFSGLTLGLLGLDMNGLRIVQGGDDRKRAKLAEKIAPIREDGNLLLCTLLLGNVAVNALLSIIMADFAGGLAGFFVSTFVIVIFGEIIPQAACSRYALEIGARVIPLVQVIKYTLYILSKPLALALDKMLGKEVGVIYTTAELIELIHIHDAHGAVDKQQSLAIEGAIKYKDLQVEDVMTPKEDSYMVSQDDVLSFAKLKEIFQTGFSRIPVYGQTTEEIVGMLFVKDLIFVDPEDETPVKVFLKILNRQPIFVDAGDNLGSVLSQFKKGHGHMAIVRDVDASDETKDPVRVIKGVITLEDIVEEILGEEIIDETDEFVDVDNHIKVENRAKIDLGRLSLLDNRLVDEKMSSDEVNALCSHLTTNIPQFVNAVREKLATKDIIKGLLETKAVSTRIRHGDGLGDPSDKDIIYRRNEPCSYMTVVLSGKIGVVAGKDQFKSEQGTWAVLGADAVWEDEFVPDFTAHVATDTLRYVQISREEFLYFIKRLETRKKKRERQITARTNLHKREASKRRSFNEAGLNEGRLSALDERAFESSGIDTDYPTDGETRGKSYSNASDTSAAGADTDRGFSDGRFSGGLSELDGTDDEETSGETKGERPVNGSRRGRGKEAETSGPPAPPSSSADPATPPPPAAAEHEPHTAIEMTDVGTGQDDDRP